MSRWSKSTLFPLAFMVAAFGAGAVVVACDSEDSAIKEPSPNTTSTPTGTNTSPTATSDAGGGDSGPSDCVTNPQTHAEIINGCTDAVKITKNPTLPLLLPDGGLPPLP